MTSVISANRYSPTVPKWWSGLMRKRWAQWLAVAAGVILVLMAVATFRGKSVPAARAQRTRVVQTLVISGRVLALRKADIGSQIAGTVRRVAVEEGDRVGAGQLLVQLDDTELRAAAAEARGRVAQATAALERTRVTSARSNAEAVEQARLRARDAAATAERLTSLEKEGIASKADAETARRQAAIAQSALESAEAVSRSTGSAGSELKVVEADLRQAQEALAAANARLEMTSVEAPAAGTILTRSVEPGAAVTPGKPLLTMTLDSEMLLLAQPDEKNLPSLHVGQHARASADAYPDKRFDAVVWYVAPNVDVQRGTVDVKFRVPNPPAYLKTDMTLSIEIETGQHDSAVVVPIEAVRDLDSNPWVFSIDRHRARRRPVAIGLRGNDVLEIARGISAGDLVALAAASNLKEGDRVHADVKWP